MSELSGPRDGTRIQSSDGLNLYSVTYLLRGFIVLFKILGSLAVTTSLRSLLRCVFIFHLFTLILLVSCSAFCYVYGFLLSLQGVLPVAFLTPFGCFFPYVYGSTILVLEFLLLQSPGPDVRLSSWLLRVPHRFLSINVMLTTFVQRRHFRSFAADSIKMAAL